MRALVVFLREGGVKRSASAVRAARPIEGTLTIERRAVAVMGHQALEPTRYERVALLRVADPMGFDLLHELHDAEVLRLTAEREAVIAGLERQARASAEVSEYPQAWWVRF